MRDDRFIEPNVAVAQQHFISDTRVTKRITAVETADHRIHFPLLALQKK